MPARFHVEQSEIRLKREYVTISMQPKLSRQIKKSEGWYLRWSVQPYLTLHHQLHTQAHNSIDFVVQRHLQDLIKSREQLQDF